MVTAGLQALEFTDCLLDSPDFRENLNKHEKELEKTSQQIKRIIKEVKDLLAAAKSKCIFCGILIFFSKCSAAAVAVEVAFSFVYFTHSAGITKNNEGKMAKSGVVSLFPSLSANFCSCLFRYLNIMCVCSLFAVHIRRGVDEATNIMQIDRCLLFSIAKLK